MENRLEYIFIKYNIVEEDQREIIGIFNKSLIEISEGILDKEREKVEKVEKVEKGEKRWASKEVEEYAEENGVSLEEIEELQKLFKRFPIRI